MAGWRLAGFPSCLAHWLLALVVRAYFGWQVAELLRMVEQNPTLAGADTLLAQPNKQQKAVVKAAVKNVGNITTQPLHTNQRQL